MVATRGETQGRLASRPPPWMAILAAVFAGYYALLLHSDLTRPETAGVVYEIHNGVMLVRAVVPGSPAAHAGLSVGDRVTSANGRPIRGRLDWLMIETNLQTGEPLRLDIARLDRPATGAIVLGRAPRVFWTTTAGATLLVARSVQIVTLILAVVVAFKRPFDLSARVGAWLLATLGVYSIEWPYQIAAAWRALPMVAGLVLWVPFASTLVTAALVVTFFTVFPSQRVSSRWGWAAIWTPMVLAMAPQMLFALRAVYRPDDPGTPADWTTLKAAVTTAYALSAVAVGFRGYQGLTDITERRRVRVLVLGSLAALSGFSLVAAEYEWRPNAPLGDSVFGTPLVAVGALLGLGLPVSFAVAILRHRLFDVAYLVRRGLQYAMARRLLVSVVPVTGALFLLDLWVNRQVPLAQVLEARGWLYAGLAGLAMAARIRRDHWLDALDRRFFRERHAAERVLRSIGDDLRSTTTLAGAAPRVVVQIESALHPEWVALMTRRDEGVLAPVAAMPTTPDVEPMRVSSKTAGLLDLTGRPLQAGGSRGGALVRHLPGVDREWLVRTGVELLVPVQPRAGHTHAVLALGPKRSEEPYSDGDEDLLVAIADRLAQLIARDPLGMDEPQAFDECPGCGMCYDAETGRCPRDGAVLHPVALPRRLGGRYRLDRQVGQGGMGSVYAAFDAALERRVAVKVLREELVGGRLAAERFQFEARAAAGLRHPNVVTVHDVGVTASGRAFLVMELLDGVTLRDALRAGDPLGTGQVVTILRGIASALDAAHAGQLVHRDLKPENVFLCTGGQADTVKVLDFGLAKPLAPAASRTITETGIVVGTPGYMAPEQWRGGELSPDWDLWALAVVAFELLTGEAPYVVPPQGQPQFGDLLLGGLAPTVRPVFVRALALDSLDRPTTAKEFVDELDQVLAAKAQS